MNILHLKYAYEVARLGSVSRAAELLLVAAPNISRSIKELEADLGIRIFDRSSKGMRLTSQWEDFMSPNFAAPEEEASAKTTVMLRGKDKRKDKRKEKRVSFYDVYFL